MSFFQKLFGGIDSATQKIVQELEHQNRIWKEMTQEELLSLEDAELLSAVYARVTDCVENGALEEIYAGAERPKLLFYTAYLFEAEAANSGICSFWANYAAVYARYVEESLRSVGAEAQGELWNAFLTESGLDALAADAFSRASEKDFSTRKAKEAFEKFDLLYENLPAIEPVLAKYVRQHIVAF